jgi:hypothetical protein
VDGVDGVSVSNARIDFDGSLIITLSTGVELNVGEVVSPDLAESIKVITNGGGTSQYVLDTLASLQTQITNLIPSQTGNAGKFLTTDGTDISWASVAGALSYQGTWNASTNTPTLASSTGVNGYYYIVSTAGSTNLDGITDWQIGDWLLFNGTVWQKIDQSNLVTSVNGQTGAVSVGTVTSVAATAGTGITVTGSPITSSGTLTITNTAPDQTVALTGAGTTSISGTYPNFTITSNDAYVGTVTSVGITAGTGITVSNSPITSSGSMTVGVSTKLANFVNLSGSGLIAQNGSGALDAVTITGGTGISVAHGNGTSGNPTISLASGYGDTLNPYTSKTANYFLAAPNGSAGVPTFRAVVAADIPTAVAKAGDTMTGALGIIAGSASTPSLFASGDTNTGIFFPAADTIAFSEGGAESMRIDSSGNVGIGATPSAWTFKTLQVGLGSTSYNSGGSVYTGSNIFYDGAWKYIGTGTALLYEQSYDTGSGQHIWYGSASGTAGGTVSLLDRMRITSAGDVGIGTASPSTKLHVVGEITATQGVGGTPAFSATPSTTQSVTSATYTKVNFGTENFDTNSNFASSRFTPTVAGYYFISGSIYSVSTAAATYIWAIIFKNGGLAFVGNLNVPVSGVDGIGTVNGLLYMNGSTDYVEMYCYLAGTSPVIQTGANTVFSGFLARGA